MTLAAKVNFGALDAIAPTPSRWLLADMWFAMACCILLLSRWLAKGGPEAHYLGMPLRLRNYWMYSTGCAVACGIEERL